MCVNNANVCILDGVSTIVSTSVYIHTYKIKVIVPSRT